MRLRNLLSILENADLDGLQLKAKQLDTGYSFSDIQTFKKAMESLSAVPVFEAPISALRDSAMGAEEKDYLDQRNQAQAEDIKESAAALFHGARALLLTLRQLMPADAANVLNIQIPEPVNIKKLMYVCSKLEKTLQGSVVGDYTKGKSAICHIDPAANWIEIDVGTEAALCLAGDLAWSAAVVYGKYQEAKIFEEHVRALKLKPESLEDIKKGQNEAIVRLIHMESHNLVERHLNGNGGQMEKLKIPIKLMADLIKDGVRVYPPEDATDNVKALFPDYDKLGEIESRAPVKKKAPEPEPEPQPEEPVELDVQPEPIEAEAAEEAPEEKADEAPEAPEADKSKAETPKPVTEPKVPVLPKQASFNDTVDLEV
ncbi:hypothetical protein [Desulfatibacillum aliphaticivorans]|uniref:hypothetical protein n=1 Tax=Desulfatibacillum aliphaticivorans TaxID=218208 RepID=UPI0004223226|nr:hypothetical protein [Desulfatibacillum aliphaticivorans]